MLSSCFYSSFVFLCNILYAYCKDDYIYVALFSFLFVTSVAFHANIEKETTLLLDKIPIVSIILYGGYAFYEKMIERNLTSFFDYLIPLLIVSTFVSTGYLYTYGYWTKQYCFYEDEVVANYYHSALHVISCVGHILIMFLE
uniref:Uncharacterized protein n=1 Tax=viral metagenome TaxID=1070528 RepID=A0A6C0I4Q1_9ZZZZ